LLTSKSYTIYNTSSGSWFIIIKPKTKEKFRTVGCLLFWNLQEYRLKEICVVLKVVTLPYFGDSTVASSPHVRYFAILLLVDAGYWTLRRWGRLQWHNFLMKSRGNRSAGSEIRMGYEHTHRYKWGLINLFSPFVGMEVARNSWPKHCDYSLPNYINPLKTKHICFIKELNAYRAVNTLRFGYKNQSLNVSEGKSCCLLWDPYKTHKRNVGTM
jgi:hypothetical protein